MAPITKGPSARKLQSAENTWRVLDYPDYRKRLR